MQIAALDALVGTVAFDHVFLSFLKSTFERGEEISFKAKLAAKSGSLRAFGRQRQRAGRGGRGARKNGEQPHAKQIAPLREDVMGRYIEESAAAKKVVNFSGNRSLRAPSSRFLL